MRWVKPRNYILFLMTLVAVSLFVIIFSDYQQGLSLYRTVLCFLLIVAFFGCIWPKDWDWDAFVGNESTYDKEKKVILKILEEKGPIKLSEFESILEELSKDDYYGEYWADLNQAFGLLKKKSFVTETEGIVAINEKVTNRNGFPLLKCDSHGWLQPVVSVARSRTDWPWTFQELYAVNVAFDAGEEVVTAKASPDGKYEEKKELIKDRTRIEIICFWEGDYGLIYFKQKFTRKEAEEEAKRVFRGGNIRFLMSEGKVLKENKRVRLTGTWPLKWKINSFGDVGFFCAFIFEQANKNGGHVEAEIFRKSIYDAWPQTEILLMYISALTFAKDKLAVYLTDETKCELLKILEKVQGWKK